MIRWAIRTSLTFRLLVVAAAAVLIAVGVNQLRNMPVDVLPEFAPPYVEVQAESLGLSASETESLVTISLEQLLNGTPWLDSIRSTSVAGLSSVVLTFKPGTNVTRARQLVAERLTSSVGFAPNVAQPAVILQPLSATSRVLTVGLSSRTVTPTQMSLLARWTIRPALLAVPGVANVAIWGQRDRQLQVQVAPRQLASYHLSLDQIITTAGNAMWVSPLTYLQASRPGSGGWIETPQQRLEVRHAFPITGPAGLSKVTVVNGKDRLGDVASVVEDHQPLIGNAILKDGPGLLLVIQKFPRANTLDVTRAVQKTFDELRPGLAGIDVDTHVFRPATFIQKSLDNLTLSLLIGGLLVLLVLIGFFFQWRTVLISAVVIPLSVLSAALVLYVRGSTMNTMVLAGLVIALAVVVDDAIVDVEHIGRSLRRHRSKGRRESAVEVIFEASFEMRRVVAYGTLIIVLPLLPVFFTRGVSGSLLRPLALSYVLALLASMVVALTVTPALSALLVSRGSLGRESPLVRWLQRGYAVALERVIRTPGPALIASVGVLAAGAAVTPFFAQTLLPSFKDPNLVVRLDGPPGTSEPEMARITARASRELRSIPAVTGVSGEIGRAVLGDQTVDVNSARLWVAIDPAADYERALAAVRNTVDGYPGLVRNVQTYEQQSIRRVLTGASEPIVVRVFGPDPAILSRSANDVRAALSGIDGVTRLNMERRIEQPHLTIKVDLARAERYGLKPGDVRRSAATLLAGLEVGSLFQDQKVFQVVVWSPSSSRRNLTDVQRLLIDTPDGGHVRLSDVADVSITSTPSVIRREAVSRLVDIGVDIRGRDLGSVSRDVKRRLAQVAFPLEYHAEVLGEHAEQQANERRMIVAGIGAAIAIFLLLQAVFRSWRLAVLSFATMPFALAGGALAAFAAGDVISLGSLIGFLAVLGISARNGILLITRFQQLEQQEGEPFGPGLVLRGARERVAPIVISALATGLALTPLLVSGSIAGQEIAHPIAVIVLGGIATSTLVNLFVTPIAYLRFGSARTPATSSSVPLQGGS